MAFWFELDMLPGRVGEAGVVVHAPGAELVGWGGAGAEHGKVTVAVGAGGAGGAKSSAVTAGGAAGAAAARESGSVLEAGTAARAGAEATAEGEGGGKAEARRRFTNASGALPTTSRLMLSNSPYQHQRAASTTWPQVRARGGRRLACINHTDYIGLH